MLINADFSLRAALVPQQHQWVKSPQNGIERVMLDRVGAEKARATSLVRYAPNSYFPHHQHPGGEEILVLSGTFSADDKDYPAGWYLRNPPNSGHQPHSKEGAVIFVKLWQMSADENRPVAINTYDASNWQRQDDREVCQLFSNDSEQVSLQRLKAGEKLFAEEVKGGAEWFVIEGEIVDSGKTYPKGGWVRIPVGAQAETKAGKKGATVYLKTGHLSAIKGLDGKI